ncbi:P-loop containing nucleoside triphosphate hydrolase protein [Schizophyllum commune H4-8]|uniref:P-loop containing nucleoside triphosphate hydrolase protein n=1 Tax=Schizophyllum commune (strain H4-8 / FGSC 9210) TaxID=578458 RepID=UPI002160BEFC|nr:P-loop containing nucleoside triphosphate hydrolase protein [Schizophyllum commune H4-8]KAI5900816.1 P-loop containing nucleoside triphosphate hydrolase protein [Schizophyllum commune H4-8]
MSASQPPDPSATPPKRDPARAHDVEVEPSPTSTAPATAIPSSTTRTAEWRGFTFAWDKPAGAEWPSALDVRATRRVFKELYERAPLALTAYLASMLIMAAARGAALFLVAMLVLGENVGGAGGEQMREFVALALALVVGVHTVARILFKRRLSMDLGDTLQAALTPRLVKACLGEGLDPEELSEQSQCVREMLRFGESAPVMERLDELVVRARDALALVIVFSVLAYVVASVDEAERTVLLIVVSIYALVRIITPFDKFGGAGFTFWPSRPSYLRLRALHNIAFNYSHRQVADRHGAADALVEEYADICNGLGRIPGQITRMANKGVRRSFFWDVLCAFSVKQPMVLASLAVYVAAPRRSIGILAFVQYLVYTLNKVLKHGLKSESVTSIMKEIRELYDLLDWVETDKRRPACATVTLDSLEPQGMRIELRDVSVDDRNEYQDVDGLSVDIKPGQVVLLTGTHGSGKSTLLDAILGLEPIYNGDISINGRPLLEHNLVELRRHTAYFTANNALLPLSLRDNVLLGIDASPDLRDEIASRAIALAGLDLPLDAVMEDVDRLDSSMDAPIGQGARDMCAMHAVECDARVSSGDSQRVGIARGFARLLAASARLVLVDESATDGPEVDSLVEHVLENRDGETVIIATEYPAPLSVHADLIVCMDKGRIVQQGKHEDLISDKEGMYAKLCDDQ